MNAVLGIIDYLLYLISIVVVVQCILSILISFNVVNTHNEFVRSVDYALERMTEPMYRPIRRVLPDFGALDLSPLVVLIIINIIQRFILPALYQPVYLG